MNRSVARHRRTRNVRHPSERQSLSATLHIDVLPQELEAGCVVEHYRPESIRDFDQIPMCTEDLIRQTKLIAPLLADAHVFFMGDHDSTSLVLGMLAKLGSVEPPASMMIADFDERLLVRARKFADRFGFGNKLRTRRYNAFDALPQDLVGTFDWFYTNPPYGSHNAGLSARLFITRGCRATRPRGGRGGIILPDDKLRRWTQKAMFATQYFLIEYGWCIQEKIDRLHQYHLDDDKELTSSLMLVRRAVEGHVLQSQMPQAGERTAFSEIPLFYGRSVEPPYPRYIRPDGSREYWSASQN